MKKIDKRRREELGEEVGIEEGSRRKSRSRLKWAEHVEQMEGKRLTKRVDALRVESRRRRRRPIWEDYVKRLFGGIGRGEESEGCGSGSWWVRWQ